ncbi:MAG: LapD/MoxY N-terminal periplasmic domain-containing protein [Methylovulum sp.]|nr:LapD/MoxY N-terminal periplasmic domain-containing protein [Methylovulum sp.]
MSLRSQINVRIFFTSVAILILGGSVAIWQARSAVSKEIDSSLNLAAQLIKLNFPQSQRNAVDVSAWLPRFVSLEQTRHLKIQLKTPAGEVVKFTSGQKRTPDAETPPQWFINLVSSQYTDVGQQLATADGKQITLIIQADPLDEITEVWQESRTFFMSLLVMTLLTFLAVNLVFNKAFKAIALIVDGLKAIEEGDYQQKLPDFTTREYDHIAKAINHLTDVLDATHKENSALTLHSLEIQEEERQHLSQELHDELGQSLTAIKVMAVTAKNNKADTAGITDAIIVICDHLISVVRSMMRNLHPLVLTELGLKATLEDLLNHWASRNPELVLALHCPDGVDSLEQKITIQVFRVVQECVTNIVRHAQATQAMINLEVVSGKLLQLQVSDNGRGCGRDDLKAGFGLLGMRERINSLGGTLAIQTGPGQGLSINASIPLQ